MGLANGPSYEPCWDHIKNPPLKSSRVRSNSCQVKLDPPMAVSCSPWADLN